MKSFIFIIILVAVVTVLMWPICKVITQESLNAFNVPIEQRSQERGLVWRTWKFNEGNWYQCKSRFERFGFN